MSKIEVDAIDKQSGSTLTLGGSGTAVTLASGATQSGFGRTGTVDWNTTPKTGNFTAVSGEGYFINTTSGAVTMTMPSGAAGAIVSIQDYNKTFDSNPLTIQPASGEKLNGGSADGDLGIDTEGQGLTFVYVDSTVGWKTVHENEFTTTGSDFITATGGTITTCGNDKIHTFTGPGTFSVCAIAGCATNNLVSYLVIAGGAGGGGEEGGGGGAGGFREYKSPVTPYTASPLNGNPGGTSVTLTATSYPITVGAGGTGQTSDSGNPGGCGSNSSFSTITSTGGGKGAGQPDGNGLPGGSGGGGQGNSGTCGGSGNTPPVSPPQGNDGGDGAARTGTTNEAGAGGGGATSAGTNGSNSPNPGGTGGPGGNGATTSISGSPVTRAGGGGGGATTSAGVIGTGGPGGGGDGTKNNTTAQAGTANTGSGGGGGGGNAGASGGARGGSGGSGIVIIRYKFQ